MSALSDRYQFLLYDKTDTTLEGELVNFLSASESATFQGSHFIRLSLPFLDKNGIPEVSFRAGVSSPFPILDFKEKKFIRKVDLVQDTTTRFIIQQIATKRDQSGLTRIDLVLEPRRFLALDQRVQLFGTYASLTASQFLDLIVADTSDFSAGTVNVPATELRTLQLTLPNIAEAVALLLSEWSDESTTYYFAISEVGVIDILSESNLGTFHVDNFLELDQNLITLNRDADARPMANRIYGVGNDAVLTLASAGGAFELDDTVGTNLTSAGATQTVTFVTAPGAITPNSIFFLEVELESDVTGATDIDFNYKLEFLNNSNTVRATRTLTRRHPHPGDSTITATDRTSTLFSDEFLDINKIRLTIVTVDDSNTELTSFYIRFFKIGYTINSAAPVAFVEDTGSQTNYGVIEGIAKLDKPLIENKHRDGKDVVASTFVGLDSTMSGVYTAGVHAGWSASGGATLTENTTGTFIRNGTKSQKVVCTASAQGAIIQMSTFTPGFPLYAPEVGYSSEIWIYIESGAVELKLEEEHSGAIVFTGILRGVGWNFLRAENWRLTPPAGFSVIGQTPWESCALQIRALDDEGGTFYIDSICHHRGNSFLGFTSLSTAEELLAIANADLKTKKNPTLRYDARIADPLQGEGVNQIIEASADYRIGDSVLVVDRELGVASIIRITKMDRDLTSPDIIALNFDDTREGFTLILKRLTR